MDGFETIRDRMEQALVRLGVSPEDSAAIIGQVSSRVKPRGLLWCDSARRCPAAVFSQLWLVARDRAIQYLRRLDKHHPLIAVLES